MKFIKSPFTISKQISHIQTKFKCKNIFINEEFYNQSIFHLQNNFNTSKEIFAKHFKKYDEILSPLWASVELMTLGEISKWYSNLNTKGRFDEI